jgi:hypothetical protein
VVHAWRNDRKRESSKRRSQILTLLREYILGAARVNIFLVTTHGGHAMRVSRKLSTRYDSFILIQCSAIPPAGFQGKRGHTRLAEDSWQAPAQIFALRRPIPASPDESAAARLQFLLVKKLYGVMSYSFLKTI